MQPTRGVSRSAAGLMRRQVLPIPYGIVCCHDPRVWSGKGCWQSIRGDRIPISVMRCIGSQSFCRTLSGPASRASRRRLWGCC